MGVKLEDILHKHSLLIHNNGIPTYRSGSIATAPDVTVTKGIMQFGNISWTTIDDDSWSPHDGIVIEVDNNVQDTK